MPIVEIDKIGCDGGLQLVHASSNGAPAQLVDGRNGVDPEGAFKVLAEQNEMNHGRFHRAEGIERELRVEEMKRLFRRVAVHNFDEMIVVFDFVVLNQGFGERRM